MVEDKEISVTTNAAPVSPPSTASTIVDEKPTPAQQDDIEYPPTKKVVVILAGLFVSVFLVALDRTIIGTAIPTITNEFNSLNDVGWYASSYLLTLCGCQLLIGRIYTFFPLKKVFLTCVVIFEIGSAICGAAPSSTVFIIGRAIAGVGSAGIFSGAAPIFVYILPLEKRPAVMGLFGMVFGIASVAGPLLGGVFTDKVSWRWCFYINLPLGALTMVIVTLILHLPQRNDDKLTRKQKLLSLDPAGTVVFFPSIICLLLALQWGGVVYAWSSARIIVLLVLFVVLFMVFIAIQLWRQETATVPPRIIKNRNVWGGMIFTVCTGSAMMVMVYFLPIWFQAIKGVSAVKSGIMNLPMIIGLVVGSIGAGILTKKIGYYMPWMYLSAVVMPIGAGLISTFTATTTHPKWIGYQVIFGFGLGIGMQQPAVAVQTILSRRDVPTGISLVFFAQSLGGAICSSISNNIFGNKLSEGLAKIGGADVGTIAKVGATEIRHIVPAQILPLVLEIYNRALVYAFYVAVAATAASILGCLPLEWLNIKKSANSTGQGKPKPKQTDIEAVQEEVKS